MGTTASERYLASLCERTFLSLWSYPNLFRDQGQSGKGDGKELCDLLVVFGDDVIIFSDKSCAFPNTGNLAVDWGRWHRRSVEKSADQVYGAERWLRTHPDRVFLDPPCSHQLPFPLPPSDRIRVHRVVVALNAAPRCRQQWGGRGSLLINNVYETGEAEPFVLRAQGFSRGFVHVFDDVSLDAVLRELDTVGDFMAYLRAKERAFASQQIGSAAGEEELLGLYLQKTDSAGRHDFVGPDESATLFLDEGFWDGYLTSRERRAKQEADRPSRVWDALIEAFATRLADGSSYGASVREAEQALRVMASEPRGARRLLGRRVLRALRITAADERRACFMMTALEAEVAYVFLLEPHGSSPTYEAYRERRCHVLRLYLMAVAQDFPSVRRVVGIVTEPHGSGGHSEDLMFFLPVPLSEGQARDLQETRERLGILRNARERVTVVKEDEYPVTPSVPRAEPPRTQKAGSAEPRKKKRQEAARARRRNR